jgi:hypothetical protein
MPRRARFLEALLSKGCSDGIVQFSDMRATEAVRLSHGSWLLRRGMALMSSTVIQQ